ncbi:hypothetical protein EJB05_10113, partial [Eragrostis curvula]
MASRSFADLPGDIVRIVADRVSVECRPRMRAVCSAWRAAVPAEPQPWIVLQPDGDTVSPEGGRRSGFAVLSLTAGVNLSPDSSVVRSLDAFPAGSRCVGAGHGWLALVGTDDLSVTLLNPVTGRHVSLPPLTKHPIVGGLLEDGRVMWRPWIDAWTDSGKLAPVEEFVDTFVRKLVFSASPEQDDYFAVVVGDRMSYAVYARAGAAAWETLRFAYGTTVSLVHDVVHVEGGRFLAVTRCHGTVLKLDLAVQDQNDEEEEDFLYHLYSPRVRPFSRPLLSTGAYFARGTTPHMHVENYLALVDGELYQIWASWVLSEIDIMVFRGHIVDAGVARFEPQRSPCWSEVTDLGEWAVLVGKNETVAVHAGDGTARVRGSYLYFMDSRLEEAVLCAFDLKNGKQVAACDSEALRWLFNTPPAPVWFLPSLK